MFEIDLIIEAKKMHRPKHHFWISTKNKLLFGIEHLSNFRNQMKSFETVNCMQPIIFQRPKINIIDSGNVNFIILRPRLSTQN